ISGSGSGSGSKRNLGTPTPPCPRPRRTARPAPGAGSLSSQALLCATVPGMNDTARELIGRTVGGRFRLTGFLGEGAMASVYRGEQDGTPRDVAVKIMHPELLRDATFGKRFTREAKAAARIVHENSVQILEHGADGNLLYLAMELLVGQDLFDV